MADDEDAGGIPLLEGWTSTPEVARLLGVSDSSARFGATTWGWFDRTREVRKIKFGGNWCYLVRTTAVMREKVKRDRAAAKKKQAQALRDKLDAARAWRVRVRDWARAKGWAIRMDQDLPEDVVEGYVRAHPDDPAPEEYHAVARSRRPSARP